MPIVHGVWTGTLPIALSAVGLPSGVNFTDNGNASYTLSGQFPTVGTYTYSVNGTNSAGVTISGGNQILSIHNPININQFVNPALCADAQSPSCAQFEIQFRPNGEIWIGTNNAASSLRGQWHDGTATGSDYQIRVTTLSGIDPTNPAPSVWHSLSAPVTFVYDRCSPGEDFNTTNFEIRSATTFQSLGYVEFCQQIGVDVPCAIC